MKLNIAFTEDKQSFQAGFQEEKGSFPADFKDLTPINGKDGISATHEWNGTILTIESASGRSSADLKGEPGPQGNPGKPGEPGSKGDPGEPGYTPQKGVDYFDGKDGVSGVYVGPGEMPDGYNVQIDPNGEGESLQDMIDAAVQETFGETRFQLLIDHVVEVDAQTITFDAADYPLIANVKEWLVWIGFIDCATAYTGTWHRIRFGSKANVALSSSNNQKHLYSWHKEVGGLWASSFAQSTNTSASQKIAAPAINDISPKTGFNPQYYEDYTSVTIYGTGAAPLPAGAKIQLWGRV